MYAVNFFFKAENLLKIWRKNIDFEDTKFKIENEAG